MDMVIAPEAEAVWVNFPPLARSSSSRTVWFCSVILVVHLPSGPFFAHPANAASATTTHIILSIRFIANPPDRDASDPTGVSWKAGTGDDGGCGHRGRGEQTAESGPAGMCLAAAPEFRRLDDTTSVHA